MHVLIISSLYPSTERPYDGIFVHDQALALKRMGCDVGVINPKSYDLKNLSYERSKIYDYDGIKVLSFQLFPIPYIHYPSSRYISNHIYKNFIDLFGKPDIIHSHFVFYGGLVTTWLKYAGVPAVHTEHSSMFSYDIKKRRINDVTKVFSHADEIICVSNYLKNNIERYVKNKKIHVISNMVDTNYFQPSNNKKSGNLNFTIIGSLIKRKRHDLLFRSFSNVFSKEKVILNVAGDGPERQNLINLSNDLNIQNQVKFHGVLNRPRIIKLLQQTDVLVSTSEVETFGLTIIEALSCGIPVIASNFGGPKEIINSKNGILVNDDTVAGFSIAMKKMFTNLPNYSQNIIRQECKKKYDYNVISSKLINLYKSII